MAETSIAAVTRAAAYSPNNIGNDAAILNAVAVRLREQGCEVRVISESEFLRQDPEEETILNMCRERASIRKLMQLEQEGRLVINSGTGIANCTRERMTRILLGSGIPYPESFIVDTDEVVKDKLVRAGITGCWIKRGEGHTKHREDVTYARHPQEAQEILQEFFLRGIKKAVINRHLEGDLVKFYGVVGTPFFFWFYPFEAGHSKYGAERINGTASHTEFSLDTLRSLCARAADALDIKIYGGDCIIAPDGGISIIDFNDWPSFAPCRNEAAPVIARMVINEAKQFLK